MSMQTGPMGQLPGAVVLTGVVPGYAVIPAPTPLTFLNYYDGKFLRASDLRQEQLGMQSMIELSSQAAGTPGVTYGFDVTSSGDTLSLGAGLGIDPKGRVLYLPQSTDVAISDLLASMQTATGSDASSSSAAAASSTVGSGPSSEFQPCDLAAPLPSTPPLSGADLYLVTLSAAEGLCGTDDVFGRLCDAACTTATDKPWRIEGVLLGLVPLTPGPLASCSSVYLTQTHLRSRVASAYFATEAEAGGSLISAAGLATGTWCLGATAVTGDAICLGVLAYSGGSTLFLDEWTARRERIETSPQRYWAGHMAMRPWNVFLAQVLQFQCQMAELLAAGTRIAGAEDPCGNAMTLLGRSAGLISELQKAASAGATKTPAPSARASEAEFVTTESESAPTGASPGPAAAESPAGPESTGNVLEQAIADYHQKVSDVLAGLTLASNRLLIDGGIIELPPAGYLPIDLTSQTPLEVQVQRWLGPGVDARFRVMRHDEAGFEFTRGQHLDRISLLDGLENRQNRPRVDIFIPDGSCPEAYVRQAAPPPYLLAEAGSDRSKVQPESYGIRSACDWVLFRRSSDVGSCPVAQQLDTVTLWAVTALNPRYAAICWQHIVGGIMDQSHDWQKLGEVQFEAGASTLVTPASTVDGWWNSSSTLAGSQLAGVAYAPASAADPIGRGHKLAAALPPTAIGATVQYGYTALAVTPPRPLENGTAGALFLLALAPQQAAPR
jgi:hypothetical protein